MLEVCSGGGVAVVVEIRKKMENLGRKREEDGACSVFGCARGRCCFDVATLFLREGWSLGV